MPVKPHGLWHEVEFHSCIICLSDIYIFSLRDRAQVEQLLRYIIEEPSEDADSKRAFKYDPLP